MFPHTSSAELNSCSLGTKDNVLQLHQAFTRPAAIGDLFEDMFTQADEEQEPELTAKKCKLSVEPLLAEIDEVRDSRVPKRDHTGFCKFSRLARLKVCA